LILTAVFTIQNEQQAAGNVSESTLLFETGAGYCCYALLHKATNTFTQLGMYRFEGDSSPREQLTTFFTLHPELVNQHSVVISYHYPSAVLTPEAYYQVDQAKASVELVYGDLEEGMVISEQVSGWNMYNAYRIPAEVNDLLSSRFPGARYWHSYSVLLKTLRKDQKNLLQVAFYHNRITVAAVKSGALQLVQDFPYQTAEEVAYYLLSICGHTGLDHKTTLLCIGGLIEEKSAMYAELIKYFSQIENAARPAAYNYAAAFDVYPAHFFTPVFNIGLCV
jgi:Protein of unknown function (DUF3822)